MINLLFLIRFATATYPETKSDATTLGNSTLYTILTSWLVISIAIVFCRSRPELIYGFSRMITFIQFSRYVPLINLNNTVFYKEF